MITLSQLIPQELIDTVRQETNIVEVVENYVQLKKSGKNYLGLCPFHNEKTPSFTVAEDKQIFHCFGCGKGGNVFTFIQEIEGLSFPESVEKLAVPLNVSLPTSVYSEQRSTEKNQTHQTLITMHEHAKKFFHHILVNTEAGKEAMAYLESRDIPKDVIEEFEIGFAPDNRQILLKVMEKEFDETFYGQSGLFVERDDGSYTDRFVNRIMFPIKDAQGKTIGFSGRMMPSEQAQQDVKQPKYLNSPETEIFNKRDVIYNFHLARPHIRKSNDVFLFEGFMDVIASHMSGVKNAVATMGTSLTEQQINRLERVCQDVTIVYDGDAAGINATNRAVELLTDNTTLGVQVVMLPNRLDPDEYRKTYGLEALENELKHHQLTVFQFKKQFLSQEFNLDNESDVLTYLDLVLQELAKIPSVIEKDFALTQLSEEYHVSKDTLQIQLNSFIQSNKAHQFKKVIPKQPEVVIPKIQQVRKQTVVEKAERLLIYRILKEKAIFTQLVNKKDFSFVHDEYQELFQHIASFYELYGQIELADFINYLKEENLRQLLVTITMQDISQQSNETEISDCLHVIKKASIQSKIDDLMTRQQTAKQTGNAVEEMEVTLEIIQLQKKLSNW